ncbi:MAG TPA: hypothetical protein VN736_27340 [Candidatus Limnocylindrales bacterium]|nr:hypothetical protein [Candidatus Limnocylindrales bacterium]
MSTYEKLAHDAYKYGDEFVNRAPAIASQIGIPAEWLLAIIALETSDFKASGPPWGGRNPFDHGGGIIGFTGADGGAWEHMTPTQQLDLLPAYFTRLKAKLDISTFRSPIEAYFLVRAPGGLLMGPRDTRVGGKIDWGGSRGIQNATRQDVVDIATRIFKEHGLTWSEPTVGMEGKWSVRIGPWLGMFVFKSDGYVWYATDNRRSAAPGFPTAEPEIAESDRTYGHWEKVGASVRWRFGAKGNVYSDIRRWEAPLAAPAPGKKWDVTIRPVGQGFAKMWRGSPEPALTAAGTTT